MTTNKYILSITDGTPQEIVFKHAYFLIKQLYSNIELSDISLLFPTASHIKDFKSVVANNATTFKNATISSSPVIAYFPYIKDLELISMKTKGMPCVIISWDDTAKERYTGWSISVGAEINYIKASKVEAIEKNELPTPEAMDAINHLFRVGGGVTNNWDSKFEQKTAKKYLQIIIDNLPIEMSEEDLISWMLGCNEYCRDKIRYSGAKKLSKIALSMRGK